MKQYADFQKAVWNYYSAHKRSMPWRAKSTPYYVLVSEVMLQQTQVLRVVPKFGEFTRRFPDFASLAAAPLGDVLAVWSGLGYNRRAKFLWQAAQRVVIDFNGQLPRTMTELVLLPGIGANTAGAIVVYAYNEPAVFIETNIRTVFIHHFFNDSAEAVTDAQLRELVAKTLPQDNPREWYWALMDYGTHLKTTVGTYLGRVHGHRPQRAFKGSRRQVRGQVLAILLREKSATEASIAAQIADTRLPEVIGALCAEGLICRRNGALHLT